MIIVELKTELCSTANRFISVFLFWCVSILLFLILISSTNVDAYREVIVLIELGSRFVCFCFLVGVGFFLLGSEWAF